MATADIDADSEKFDDNVASSGGASRRKIPVQGLIKKDSNTRKELAERRLKLIEDNYQPSGGGLTAKVIGATIYDLKFSRESPFSTIARYGVLPVLPMLRSLALNYSQPDIAFSNFSELLAFCDEEKDYPFYSEDQQLLLAESAGNVTLRIYADVVPMQLKARARPITNCMRYLAVLMHYPLWGYDVNSALVFTSTNSQKVYVLREPLFDAVRLRDIPNLRSWSPTEIESLIVSSIVEVGKLHEAQIAHCNITYTAITAAVQDRSADDDYDGEARDKKVKVSLRNCDCCFGLSFKRLLGGEYEETTVSNPELIFHPRHVPDLALNLVDGSTASNPALSALWHPRATLFNDRIDNTQAQRGFKDLVIQDLWQTGLAILQALGIIDHHVISGFGFYANQETGFFQGVSAGSALTHQDFLRLFLPGVWAFLDDPQHPKLNQNSRAMLKMLLGLDPRLWETPVLMEIPVYSNRYAHFALLALTRFETLAERCLIVGGAGDKIPSQWVSNAQTTDITETAQFKQLRNYISRVNTVLSGPFLPKRSKFTAPLISSRENAESAMKMAIQMGADANESSERGAPTPHGANAPIPHGGNTPISPVGGVLDSIDTLLTFQPVDLIESPLPPSADQGLQNFADDLIFNNNPVALAPLQPDPQDMHVIFPLLEQVEQPRHPLDPFDYIFDQSQDFDLLQSTQGCHFDAPAEPAKTSEPYCEDADDFITLQQSGPQQRGSREGAEPPSNLGELIKDPDDASNPWHIATKLPINYADSKFANMPTAAKAKMLDEEDDGDSGLDEMFQFEVTKRFDRLFAGMDAKSAGNKLSYYGVAMKSKHDKHFTIVHEYGDKHKKQLQIHIWSITKTISMLVVAYHAQKGEIDIGERLLAETTDGKISSLLGPLLTSSKDYFGEDQTIANMVNHVSGITMLEFGASQAAKLFGILSHSPVAEDWETMTKSDLIKPAAPADSEQRAERGFRYDNLLMQACGISPAERLLRIKLRDPKFTIKREAHRLFLRHLPGMDSYRQVSWPVVPQAASPEEEVGPTRFSAGMAGIKLSAEQLMDLGVLLLEHFMPLLEFIRDEDPLHPNPHIVTLGKSETKRTAGGVVEPSREGYRYSYCWWIPNIALPGDIPRRWMCAIGFQGQHLLLELNAKLVFVSVHFHEGLWENIDITTLHSPYPDFINDCAAAAARLQIELPQ